MEILVIIALVAVGGYILYKIFNPGLNPVVADEAIVFPSAPLEPEVIELVISPVEAPVVNAIAPVALTPIEPVVTAKPAAKKAATKKKSTKKVAVSK